MDLNVEQVAAYQTYIGEAVRSLPPLNGFFDAGIAVSTDPTLPEDKKLVVFDVIDMKLTEDGRLSATRQAALKSAYWAWKLLDDQYVDQKGCGIMCLCSCMFGPNSTRASK